MIVKEYVIQETSKEDLASILIDFFGSDYSYSFSSSGYTRIYKTDFPYYAIAFPSSNSSSGLWAVYSSDGSSWSDLSSSTAGGYVKIRIYKEEGKFIYVTGITSDNKEYYAGGFFDKSYCFVWMDSIYYESGTSNRFNYTPITVDNYLSLAPFFNPYEKFENPDYSDIYLPAMRPSLDGVYTVFNINGEKYATMCRNVFVKL